MCPQNRPNRDSVTSVQGLIKHVQQSVCAGLCAGIGLVLPNDDNGQCPLYQLDSDLAADNRRSALQARQRNVILWIEQPIEL